MALNAMSVKIASLGSLSTAVNQPCLKISSHNTSMDYPYGNSLTNIKFHPWPSLENAKINLKPFLKIVKLLTPTHTIHLAS